MEAQVIYCTLVSKQLEHHLHLFQVIHGAAGIKAARDKQVRLPLRPVECRDRSGLCLLLLGLGILISSRYIPNQLRPLLANLPDLHLLGCRGQQVLSQSSLRRPLKASGRVDMGEVK